MKHIERVALGDIQWLRIYHNVRRVTLGEAMSETGADLGFNGGLYDLSTWELCGHVKADGKVLHAETWGCWGLAWNEGPDIRLAPLPAPEYRNYFSGTELLTPMIAAGDKPVYGRDLAGRRGRRAEGLTGKELVFYASSDGKDAATLEEVQEELFRLGCETAVAEDGGQSVKCDVGALGFFDPARPKSATYLLVKLKKGGGPGASRPTETAPSPSAPPTPPPKGGGSTKEEKPMGKKYTVCLDPGHGVESPGKCAPDGSYYEHEFALDMARRVKGHLERCGVKVILTRDDQHCPTGRADTADLLRRVKIANEAWVDLFVSLHSNAQGGTGWGSVQGYGVYTSAGPETAARNVCAKMLLSRAREAGVSIWGGGLHHDLSLVVIRETKAPAVLVEHGFHTSREEVECLKSADYREKLAVVDAKGVCDFLGVGWVDAPSPSPAEPMTPPPSGGGSSEWYAEHRDWAVELGIADGTRPLEFCTRAEEWTMLHRLYDKMMEAVEAGK